MDWRGVRYIPQKLLFFQGMCSKPTNKRKSKNRFNNTWIKHLHNIAAYIQICEYRIKIHALRRFSTQSFHTVIKSQLIVNDSAKIFIFASQLCRLWVKRDCGMGRGFILKSIDISLVFSSASSVRQVTKCSTLYSLVTVILKEIYLYYNITIFEM